MVLLMAPAERHRRLAEIITTQDELAAAFMRLDLMVRALARAEFCEPPSELRAVEAEIGRTLPETWRAK